jgi:hypothetical protein
MGENSGHAMTPTDGPRSISGPKPLHVRMEAQQLEAACALIASGRATVEAAIRLQVATTHASIYRSRKAGVEALEAHERGDALEWQATRAMEWWSAIDAALAKAEVLLNRQALGDAGTVYGYDDKGTPLIASTRHAAQALEVLKLSRYHWRIPSEAPPDATPAPKVEAKELSEVEVRAWFAARNLPFPSDPVEEYDPTNAAPGNR